MQIHSGRDVRRCLYRIGAIRSFVPSSASNDENERGIDACGVGTYTSYNVTRQMELSRPVTVPRNFSEEALLPFHGEGKSSRGTENRERMRERERRKEGEKRKKIDRYREGGGRSR